MSFKGELAKFAAKSIENASIATRKVVLDAGSRIVQRTPVGNPDLWQSKPHKGYAGGRARGSWQYSFNTPAQGESGTIIDRDGGATIGRIEGAIDDSFGVHYITSNLVYIQALEDGYSSQAPNGMVALTALEFRDIVDIAVREAKK